jgi:ABC-type phosphate/phosphonate transport system substrate-binding protein
VTLAPLANLGMYDGGELTAANDALWEAIASRLARAGVANVPRQLERQLPLADLWASPRFLFGQTCGHPFAARYYGRLRLIATPRYALPGCREGRHRSFVVVSARSSVRDLAALRGSRAAINDDESMTGRHLLGDVVAAVAGTGRFFSEVQVTGSHAQSLARVAAGEVDIAAIDCVTYAHLKRSRPELIAGTRVLLHTRETPALPFVISTAQSEETAALVGRALAEAVADPATAEARHLLALTGLETLDPAAYDVTLGVAARADAVFTGSPAPAPASMPAGPGRAAAVEFLAPRR